MKKIMSFLLLFVFTITLAACQPTDKDKTTTDKDKQPEATTKPNDVVDDEKYDLDGMEFVIMCDNAKTCDPRSQNFERLFKAEKVQKIKDAEEKYNIKIVFQTYPSQAPWGGARERWIIEQTSLGNSPGHVYELTSYQIGTLATQNAILPLNDLIEKYGSPLYWPEAMSYGEVNGKYYSYSDSFPLADEGIYYNADLLEYYLGENRRHEPTELWLDGKWDWDAFRSITDELNTKLDENRSGEDGGPQYVLGGRTYNWAYQMIGANGGHLVNPDFTTDLTSEETLNALNFLNELYETPGMWIDDAPLNNASQNEFRDGNVAFHNGQSYWLFQDSKWKDRSFAIGFVPYPTGDNTKEDLSNYYINDVYGKAAYVISAAYSKDLIPEGYEDLMIHDETIFKIWADLQYFPGKDPVTGYADIEVYADEFYITRLMPNYGDAASRDAHLSIIDKSYPDYFYSMNEANNHNEESYMIKIQNAIRVGDIRNHLTSIESEVRSTLMDKYQLPEDFYN